MCVVLPSPSRSVPYLVVKDNAELRAERLYFFQFPEPFPTFISPSTTTNSAPEVPKASPVSEDSTKKVSFADDTKPAVPAIVPSASGSTTATSGTPEPARLDGMVGHLEIYQSGAVKIRFGNGIVMDVRYPHLTLYPYFCYVSEDANHADAGDVSDTTVFSLTRGTR
jgi:hypothetical protein